MNKGILHIKISEALFISVKNCLVLSKVNCISFELMQKQNFKIFWVVQFLLKLLASMYYYKLF